MAGGVAAGARGGGNWGDKLRLAVVFVSSISATITLMAAVGSQWLLLVVVLLLFAWMAFDILLHEVGHAVMARLCGWDIIVFAAGPYAYHVQNRETAYLDRRNRGEFAGYVLPSPRSERVWTLGRHMLISVGGPLANFIAAAILFLIHGHLPVIGVASTYVDWSMVALAMAQFSLGAGFYNILPFGMQDCDGKHIRGYARLSAEHWRRYRALGQIQLLLKYRVRLRDLPMWMVEESRRVATESDSDDGLAQSSHAVDVGIILDSPPVDLAEARQYLDDHLRLYGDSEWLASCDAYFTAVWEGDAERARARLWTGAASSDEMRPLVLAAAVSVEARAGNVELARQLLADMRAANAAQTVFTDHTFRDIGRQIDDVIAGASRTDVTAGRR